MDSISYYRGMSGEFFSRIKKFTKMQELLEYDLSEFPDDVAVSWNEGDKTYKEVYHDVAKVRKLLLSKGAKKGQNIGMVFKNEYNFVITFFAITTLGCCAAIVPPALPAKALYGFAMKYDLAMYVYGVDAEPNFIELKNMLPNMTCVSYKELEGLVDEAPADESVKPEDAACIIFTGGTTGTPKGAVLSNRALTRGGYNGCFIEGNPFRLKYMVLIPFLHVFGLVRNLLASFNSGSNIYLVKEMMNFIREIKDAKPEIMVMVPALCNLIYSIVAQHGIEAVGGKLRLIIAGGANVTSECIQRLLKVGIVVCPGYGLTETANLTCGSIEYRTRPSSVGMVYPEQEVKIVNHEIYIKGDNLFTCYYKDEAETKNVMTEDGFLRTGDLGHFDEDGFLYIDGRSKNIIVLDNGENVSPEIIENALDNIPLINSSLIYEDKDENGKGIIAVKIFPQYPVLERLGYKDVDKTINDLVAKVNSSMPSYMRVHKVVILKEDFKRSPSMKILRKQN